MRPSSRTLLRFLFFDSHFCHVQDRFYRIVSLEFCRTEERHEDCLSFGAFVRTILLGDFSYENGLSHLLFCVIVIRTHLRVFQECEQFLLVPSETLDQSLSILVSIGCCQKRSRRSYSLAFM